MNTTDNDFFRAFAGRVRHNIATTSPEGSPDVNDTTLAETTEAPAVPATFLAPDAPCERNAWCVRTSEHDDCFGPEIGLSSPAEGDGFSVLTGQLTYDAEDDGAFLLYQRAADDWNRTTSDALRAETARVRAHLARLDALADQYDAIRTEYARRSR